MTEAKSNDGTIDRNNFIEAAKNGKFKGSGGI